MSLSRQAGLKRPAAIALATAAMTALAMATAGNALAGPSGARSDTPTLYLVQVAGDPLATYAGGVSNIPGTKPADGQKLRPRAWNYAAYRDYLKARRAEVLRRAGVDAKKAVVSYDTVFNGFAAKLTSAEVAKLRHTKGIVNVWKNQIIKVDTVTTPRFLGLDGPGGVWQRQFGDVSRAGEGVIVGVVDSGFWPESPSFAPLSEPRPDQAIIDEKWSGTCVTGNTGPVTCNNKVIGARFYRVSQPELANPNEFDSPRDLHGHGSHTASTAAGDNGVPMSINGLAVGNGSGMAPAARLAIYKALWTTADGTSASGGFIDLMNAIDDAVADGVDVINYSISGSLGTITDPVEIAFLNAAVAGVFVSASAGNSGPAAGTVAHTAPWETTVAASTHDRSSTKRVTLGNGASYVGAGVGPAMPAAPFIDAANAALAGANPLDAARCFVGSLDPAKVTGKGVLCLRGTNPRTEKSRAVKVAGGVAMILYNASPAVDDVIGDYHFVPSIHVHNADGLAIKAYINGTANPTAAFSAPIPVPAPVVAGFSSRGPDRASGGDLVKPDIAAPGVDVIASVSPPGPNSLGGNQFNSFSGTSMAAPHIAGIAALIRSKNPTWSPMAIKSALMTTAGTLDNSGNPIAKEDGGSATPLDFGAGHVRAPSAFDPGLIYESGPIEWLQYACGIGDPIFIAGPNGEVVNTCDLFGAIDPSNLNYPSIAVAGLTGKQTLVRTVTNVARQASVYFAQVKAPPGFSVNVVPPVIVVPPRKSVTYKIEITRTTAAFGAWSFGSLSWGDTRGHNVRSPIAVQALPLAAPAEIVQSGISGSVTVPVRAGYTGVLNTAAHGLAASTVTNLHLVGTEQNFDPDNPATSPAVGKVTVTAPAGTKVARFATFAADYGEGADIDLFAYAAGTTALVGASAGGTADESITLPAGSYDVFVVQFATPTGVSEQDVKLNAFVVAPGAAGNLSVTPASQPVTIGAVVNVTLSWNGLTAGKHYLGVVEYSDGTAVRGTTLVTVNA